MPPRKFDTPSPEGDELLLEALNETSVAAGATEAHQSAAPIDLEAKQRQEFAQKEEKRRALNKSYLAERKVSVSVAPQYAAHFGRIMTVSVNGQAVAIPCDGRPYNIPESFAMVVQERLYRVNRQELRGTRLADVAQNFESYPGAAQLY